MSDKIDLSLSGNGEAWRIERLMRTYLHIKEDLRAYIVKLADQEGTLTAFVTDKNINTYTAIRDAWAFEAEHHVVIVHANKIVCESYG